MNGNYYNNGYANNQQSASFGYQKDFNNLVQQRGYDRLYDEDNYIDNILKFNVGKKIRVSTATPNGTEMKSQSFEGIIENVGKDYLIISDPKTGEWLVVPLIYITFITFEEPIKYN